MARNNTLGTQGELIAKEYLEKLDYEILEENWTFKKAELDLVAYKDQTIIFVEVKTRSGNGFGQPEDFVNEAKQKLLVLAAEEYIHLMDHRGEIRFDIISILFTADDKHILRHIEDAFWPEA
ncbi:MAG: YraN family protein [Daejeonella sp.]